MKKTIIRLYIALLALPTLHCMKQEVTHISVKPDLHTCPSQEVARSCYYLNFNEQENPLANLPGGNFLPLLKPRLVKHGNEFIAAVDCGDLQKLTVGFIPRNTKNMFYYQISQDAVIEKSIDLSQTAPYLWPTIISNFVWINGAWIAIMYQYPDPLVLCKLNVHHQGQAVIRPEVIPLKLTGNKILLHKGQFLPHPQTATKLLVVAQWDKHRITEVDLTTKKFRRLGEHDLNKFSIHLNGIPYALKKNNDNSFSLMQKISIPLSTLQKKIMGMMIFEKFLIEQYSQAFTASLSESNLTEEFLWQAKKVAQNLAYVKDYPKKRKEFELKTFKE